MSATPHTLSVADDYDLVFGSLIESDLLARLLAERQYAGLVCLADENTRHHCLPHLQRALAGADLHPIVVPTGELHKTIDTCQHIWRKMFAAGVGRRWCCLNLGGGVVGDMGGFAAATFKRGIDFVQIPTTLLSQVDASVGGKLGIDFHGLKNSIGLFADPRAVFIDPTFLNTLPPRELRSGYAEVIKHALIADADHWNELRRSSRTLPSMDWAAIIPRSVDIKRRIVELDPFEAGPRKALNYGHTVGHAVESYFLERGEERLYHGEAIAIGMVCESYLSRQQTGLGEQALRDIVSYIYKVYGHHHLPEDSFAQLLTYMRQDKKNDGREINFALLSTAGKALVNQTATEEDILRSLRYYNELGAVAGAS